MANKQEPLFEPIVAPKRNFEISDQRLRASIILELKDICKAISDHDALQAGQLMRVHVSHLDQQLSRDT